MACYINFVAWCFLLQVIKSFQTVAETQTGSKTKMNDFSDADFFLAGLFPIHSSSSDEDTCDSIRMELPGVEYAEAMLFALDSINSNTKLLPDITLGYDIRDTCSMDYVAIDDGAEWVTNKIVQTSCDCLVYTSPDVGPLLIAVIGATFSKVSAPVATVLRPFGIPQISHASTSSSFNLRESYSYFLRTVPPDSLQAAVMVSILEEMEWTVVSAIHSNEIYGETGMEEFREAIDQTSICIDIDESIEENFSDKDYAALAEKLVAKSVANVVIFFSLPTFVNHFFRKLAEIETDRKFLWIASDGWAESQDIQHSFADQVAGMLGIVPFVEPSDGFQDYFSQLTKKTNERDPWFDEYCETYAERLSSDKSEETCSSSKAIPNFPEYTQNVYVPTVIDAVYSAAHGLHDFLTDNCDGPPYVWNSSKQSCIGQKADINGSALLHYITNVNFQSPTGRKIQYGKDGYVTESAYEIKNLQKIGGANNYTVVGKWNPTQKLSYIVPRSSWQFGLTSEGSAINTLNSQCTTCEAGSVTLLLPSSCCNLCTQCLGQNYSQMSTDTSCSTCDNLMWGNNPLTGSDACVPIEQSFVNYQKPGGIVLLLLQIVGLLSLVIITVPIVILLFMENPSIEKFGMEYLAMIFSGLLLCFLLPAFYIVKPSVEVCVFQKLLFWLSPTLVYAALLAKLIRITQDFLGDSISQRWQFKGIHYHIIFTFVIVGGQLLFVIISMAVTPPGPFYFQQNNTMNANDFPELIVTCDEGHTAIFILQVVYETVLIILINGLAIFTIKFPKNHNESRHIAFAAFAIGMIWIAFIPTYVATSNETRSASSALAVMVMGFAVLVCLIGLRLFIAFRTCTREVEGEQSFTTTTKEGEISQHKDEFNITSDKSNENESK